ncbi:MAG: L-threonylcarbamoyladenylate synthase [Nitratireductor sp.]
MARIIDIRERDAQEAAIGELRAGRCIAIPTETVYGLAADACNGVGVATIFAMKGRPRFNPLICHVDGLAMAETIGVFDPVSRKLANHFWPGPLTLVVSRRKDSGVHDLVTADLDTVAIRAPASPSRAVIAAFGKPLAAPSANRSGRISPTQAQHVGDEYRDEPLLVLDAGPARVGLESTIVKVEDGHIVLLRPGGISKEEIEALCGIPVIEPRAYSGIVAPGMLESHYAPEAGMVLDIRDCPQGAALLAFGSADGKDRSRASSIRNLSQTGDLTEAAANLYSMMKELDAEHPALIAVETIPGAGLASAINDRLKRAAAPRPDKDETR